MINMCFIKRWDGGMMGKFGLRDDCLLPSSFALSLFEIDEY